MNITHNNYNNYNNYVAKIETRKNILRTQGVVKGLGAPLSELLVYQVSASQPLKTTMEDTLTDNLISILKDRGIPVKEVIESFEDNRNTQWASKHLRPDTLLSKDELALYVSSVQSQDRTNWRQIPQARKLRRSSAYSQQPRLRCNTACLRG